MHCWRSGAQERDEEDDIGLVKKFYHFYTSMLDLLLTNETTFNRGALFLRSIEYSSNYNIV